jgi:hypothetical protein
MVTFHMSAANGMSSDYCVGSGSPDWLTITTAAGKPITMTNCGRSCAGCAAVTSTLVYLYPRLMKAGGETLRWDGSYWKDGTCGASLNCKSHECVTPGHYIAKMCASHSLPESEVDFPNYCPPTPALTCVEVPFDFPPTGVVEGKIP